MTSNIKYLEYAVVMVSGLVLGCGSDADTGGDLIANDTVVADTGSDVGQDLVDMQPDAGGDGPDLSGFGGSCRSNLECESGYCVSSANGFVCTRLCGDQPCPDLAGQAMACRVVTNFGADEVEICMPFRESICSSCLTDMNCLDGSCIVLPAGSQVCGRDCRDSEDCPTGTYCFSAVPGLGDLETSQCLPANLSCDCAEENADEVRPCARSNEDRTRTCIGEERCDPELGWVGCSAAVPVPESCDNEDNDCNGAADDGLSQYTPCEVAAEGFETTCDGVLVCMPEEGGMVCVGPEPTEETCDFWDNDCDGTVDQPFLNPDGQYVLDTDCGTCGNDCSERYPEGYTAACQVVDGRSTCVVIECPQGMIRVGLTACIPLASSLCSLCQEDSDCNATVGDRCLPYPDGQQYCGRDCSPTSPFGQTCPPQYACDAIQLQCIQESGSCACSEDDDFYLPCRLESVTAPGQFCSGTVHCLDGALGECLPLSPEACDGIDNDCKNGVDDGFLDPLTGQYERNDHCGACNNDCTSLFTPELHHAVGQCLSEDESGAPIAPYCTPVCITSDWRDANRLAFDGCECQWQADDDPPDENGIDANCDGVDGDVDLAVFVATNGSDETGDGSIDNPYASVQYAIDTVGTDASRSHVYVAAGVYRESLLFEFDPEQSEHAVSVFGGYSYDYAHRDIKGNETAIIGLAPTSDRPATVTFRMISDQDVVFDGFTVVGRDTTVAASSSYAIHVVGYDEALRITHNVIRAGSGGNGLPGSNGPTGHAAEADPGYFYTFEPAGSGLGADVVNDDLDLEPMCTGTSPPLPDRTVVVGGDGATFECLRHDDVEVQTHGGQGGTADCPVGNRQEPLGGDGMTTPGASAARPDVSGGPGGAGGYSYTWDADRPGYRDTTPPYTSECVWAIVPDGSTATVDGRDGKNGERGDDGLAGEGCFSTGGQMSGGHWVAGDEPTLGAGGDGGRGGPGSGGGGGGAGGGTGHCDASGDCILDVEGTYGPYTGPVCDRTEIIGGGGGGGGAGGCGGEGGSGGDPGGGSFGVVVYFETPPASLPHISRNTIYRDHGGMGGDGGPGGEGGLGSEGSSGSSPFPATDGFAGVGGHGGDGGSGGAGGGGGGGCGGISTGIFVYGHSSLSVAAYLSGNTFPPTGGGGSPGRGGPSPGNSGQDGSGTLYEPVLPCPEGDLPPCGEE